MIYSYNFSEGSRWEADFSHTYSLVCPSRNSFIQEADAIVNSYNEEMKGHDYISLAHKARFSVGTRTSLVCSFESYGAPLITIANSIGTDANGYALYGDHYEIVAYEGGCNVWYITKAPDGAKRPFLNDCCLRVNFPIEAGSKIELGVATGKRAGFTNQSPRPECISLRTPNQPSSRTKVFMPVPSTPSMIALSFCSSK